MIDAASDVFRPVLAFALGTGCRRGEIMSLRWKDVSLKRGEVFIRAENSKTKQGRVVPLPPELTALLRTLRASQATRKIDGEDPVLQPRAGQPWAREGFRKYFPSA